MTNIDRFHQETEGQRRAYIDAHALRDVAPHVADWLTALRSGDFEQGTGAMYNEPIEADEYDDDSSDIPETWCCLGVACTLAAVRLVVSYTGDGWGVPADMITHVPSDELDAHVPSDELDAANGAQLGNMPTWLTDTLGLDRHDEFALTVLNDGNATFPIIADIVEHWHRSHAASIVAARDDMIAAGVLSRHLKS